MKKLGQLLRDELEARHMSPRQLSLETGLSQTTITRVMAGLTVDFETVLTVCNWLGINPIDAFDHPDATTSENARKIAVLMEREPELGAVFTAALNEVEAGNMSSDDLRDIIEYATFKLEHYRMRRRNQGQDPKAQQRRAKASS
jgi:transcriptional regulator with XRE-family HTH domain